MKCRPLYPWAWRSIQLVIGACVFVIVGTVLPASGQTPANPPRERLLMDSGWRFFLGNEWGIAQNLSKAGTGSGPASASFSDASWRVVNLPHDWAVELPFNINADSAHGFKALGRGFDSNSVAWYRRTFVLPEQDQHKRIWIEFDGVFRDSEVFVNGWFVGRHESGYSSFRYDITDVIHAGGPNLVAVKVDASQFEGWFYEGAGIYRHVWLVKTGPVAIAPDGIFVRSQFPGNRPGPEAEVVVQTLVHNSTTNSANVAVVHEIVNPAGQSVARIEQSGPVRGKADLELNGTAKVTQPQLWSPEKPDLYRLITTVHEGGQRIDRKETVFGIRTIAMDPNRGFILNGEPYVIKGTCNHQDHAGVGTAMPDELHYFRVSRLKEMGSNAYRTSHNPPTPELLEACDRLGMLVMDENRLLGADAKHMGELERLVRRDRNHPSVVFWCIANEEFTVQSSLSGARAAAAMQELVLRLDPTRPVTYAAPQGNDFWGINSVIQVRGWNYHLAKGMDQYHAEHPQQPNIGTEQGSTVSTRGIYVNDPARGYVSAYDTNVTSWSNTAEQWWSYFAARPWLSGGFVWTGFDYRGEPTPYHWPCINSHFGIFDLCGFPKDNFYYYQSWWSDKTVLHLLPHWNWQGREGSEIEVRALSNCDSVELFLNGQSLGTKSVARNSHAAWLVKYAPGTLSAKGYRDGKVVAETKRETTGQAAALRLHPHKPALKADNEDIAVITVSLHDGEGRVIPTGNRPVQFDLSGPGKILGAGNGDPSSHEPDVFIPRQPITTRPIGGWRMAPVADPYQANIPEMQIAVNDSSWQRVDVTQESGPLGQNSKAAFRARFTLSHQDMEKASIELCFGMIDEEGFVYVNGQKVGESRDWRAAPVFDIKRFVKAGENTVAVALANWTGSGGVNKGAWVALRDDVIPVQWERSVFNGLAQIIVQAGSESGEITLTARAGELRPAVLKLPVQRGTPRPGVAAN
ncbi:MAG TPA: beta-galactosidase GalA [Verrucomicrobiae bacterium]|nr:beta-galactosidase GalA [Verrucomicrobiae bacterium]